jgi:hypothetical protein
MNVIDLYSFNSRWRWQMPGQDEHVDAHVHARYELKEKLGKGVRLPHWKRSQASSSFCCLNVHAFRRYMSNMTCSLLCRG